MREDGDPDDVDEVPVHAHRLDGDVVVSAELAARRAGQQDRQPDGAAEDVRAVEAGERVEDRAEHAVADPEAELAVVVQLAGEEEDAEPQRDRRSTCLQLAGVAAADGPHAELHREARGDEDRGQDRGERQVEVAARAADATAPAPTPARALKYVAKRPPKNITSLAMNRSMPTSGVGMPVAWVDDRLVALAGGLVRATSPRSCLRLVLFVEVLVPRRPHGRGRGSGRRAAARSGSAAAGRSCTAAAGEVVAHSSVLPSHGSSPAGSPLMNVAITLIRNGMMLDRDHERADRRDRC